MSATRDVSAPRGLRAIEEVVPRLGAKAGFPALRIGTVTKYDRPVEHLSGQLDVAPLKLPLRARDGRYGLVLCFSLEAVDPPKLARELVRVAHPDGTGWVDNKILSLGEHVYATRYERRRRPGKA